MIHAKENFFKMLNLIYKIFKNSFNLLFTIVVNNLELAKPNSLQNTIFKLYFFSQMFYETIIFIGIIVRFAIIQI